jgi:hypothetical protein
MKYSLDSQDDTAFVELHKFLGGVELPDYVKTAEFTDRSATSELEDTAFADQYHRAFCIKSAADVYLSNSYFINKKAELKSLWGENYVNTVEERINKAAELFDIKKDVDNYNSNLNEKKAFDYTEKNVADIDVAGTVYSLFPYKTAEDLQYQAEQFASNISNYPFSWRETIAKNFIEKSAELNIDEVPDIIAKYGGLFYPDVREFSDILASRMNKLSEARQAEYAPLIKRAEDISSREEAMAICGEAYIVEKRAGVYEKPILRDSFGDVVDKSFSLDICKIAGYLNCVKIGSDMYDLEDLKKVPSDIYKQAFDCELDPSNTDQLREVLPTMPRSDFALFQELSGVKAL